MIWLNPVKVMLGSFELRNVSLVAVDRGARRLVEEWTDLGPHVGFVDVPEQRVVVSISRHVVETETVAPKPGESHTLTFRSSAGLSAAGVRLVSIAVVVTSVEHAMTKGGRATQSIRAVAVSSDGAADPVVETLVEGEV
ncbi:MAG: hypothetical protein JNK58_06150 [Phycisphaerae bacterium]|nr:hypothetical protein [Phycisphaerae bacterium]